MLAAFNGLHLVDQDGRPYQPAQSAGHITLVNFVYTTCSSVCPLQTQALAQVQRALPLAVRQRVRLMSVSIDPRNDTPATLKAYASRMGADLSTWVFLTGRPQDIARLSDTLKLFKEGSPGPRLDAHATWLWLLDGQGEVRQRYAGNPPDARRLTRELIALDGLRR